MRKIHLSQNKTARVDEVDISELSAHSWYAQRGRNTFYAVRKMTPDETKRNNGIRGTVKMHRQIMRPTTGVEVDHINGNGLDNRRSNLRTCTRQQNSANQRNTQRNKTGYTGVYLHKKSGKFCARVRKGGVVIKVRYFSTALAAHKAYRNMSQEVFGIFSRFTCKRRA